MTFEPKNFDHLIGTPGFGEQLLKNHFALYQGYVKNVNAIAAERAAMMQEGKTGTPAYAEITRRFGWEFNGMRLHELYFGNMDKAGAPLAESSACSQKLAQHYGAREQWEKEFRAVGGMRGIGWAVLYHDPISGNLFNTWVNEHDMGHLAGATPLLVLDIFEHAYTLDYGIKKTDYIDAFFKAINWSEVERRFSQT